KALAQLQFAVRQLEEVKRDRHVQVFADAGRRWQSPQMVEALKMQLDYTPETLAELFARGEQELPSTWHPLARRRRKREARARVVLQGVPNYFEEAVITAKAGGLDEELFADNFGGVAIQEWWRWRLAVNEIRRVMADDLAYVEFERFALS